MGICPQLPRARTPHLSARRGCSALTALGVGLTAFSPRLEVLLLMEPAVLSLGPLGRRGPSLLLVLSDLMAVGLVGGVCLLVCFLCLEFVEFLGHGSSLL